MTSLLDVNVLIGLLDANHAHHAAVMGWFSSYEDTWASCPITQNAYVRIVTQNKYANTISIMEAVKKLSAAVATPNHEFISDDISLLEPKHVLHREIQGNKQVTDIHLLALSVSHGAQFVTLDKGVSHVAVQQATEDSIHVIRP